MKKKILEDCDEKVLRNYLKIVTDHEKRPQDFADFLKRARDGLNVEADVYVTTEELLSVMWQNGYADKVLIVPMFFSSLMTITITITTYCDAIR